MLREVHLRRVLKDCVCCCFMCVTVCYSTRSRFVLSGGRGRLRLQHLREQHVDVADPRLSVALLVLQQRARGKAGILREANQQGERAGRQSRALDTHKQQTSENEGWLRS